jgi:hypothetical protein
LWQEAPGLVLVIVEGSHSGDAARHSRAWRRRAISPSMPTLGKRGEQ